MALAGDAAFLFNTSITFSVTFFAAALSAGLGLVVLPAALGTAFALAFGATLATGLVDLIKGFVAGLAGGLARGLAGDFTGVFFNAADEALANNLDVNFVGVLDFDDDTALATGAFAFTFTFATTLATGFATAFATGFAATFPAFFGTAFPTNFPTNFDFTALAITLAAALGLLTLAFTSVLLAEFACGCANSEFSLARECTGFDFLKPISCKIETIICAIPYVTRHSTW